MLSALAPAFLTSDPLMPHCRLFLNHLFTLLDSLLDSFGVAKIETIGGE